MFLLGFEHARPNITNEWTELMSEYSEGLKGNLKAELYEDAVRQCPIIGKER